MKIFILEDTTERIESFKSRLSKHDLTIFTDNATEAQEAIKNNNYDIILLDHDLGSKHGMDSVEQDTGYQFALIMVNNNLQKDATIIIHSMNPTGANHILNLLRLHDYNVQWIPFSMLKLEGK